MDEKQKFLINNTFFVNKELMLDFNFFKRGPLNFAQNFRRFLFDLANSESGEKSTSCLFTKHIHGCCFVPVEDTEMFGQSRCLS